MSLPSVKPNMCSVSNSPAPCAALRGSDCAGATVPSTTAKMTEAKAGPGNAWRNCEATADQQWKTMTRRPCRNPSACAASTPQQHDQISDKDFGGRSGGMGSAAMSTLGANERTTICAKLTGLAAST